jgi:phage gp36-like protein
MAYSDQDDILEQIDEAVLIQLTDPSGTAIDEDVVSRAIEDADATIDSYCQGRYTAPLNPAPAKVRQISVDIAIYNLFSRRADTAPDVRKDRYKEAIRWLEKVNKGDISLGAATPAATNTRDTVDISSNDRIFDRDKMSGF